MPNQNNTEINRDRSIRLVAQTLCETNPSLNQFHIDGLVSGRINPENYPDFSGFDDKDARNAIRSAMQGTPKPPRSGIDEVLGILDRVKQKIPKPLQGITGSASVSKQNVSIQYKGEFGRRRGGKTTE